MDNAGPRHILSAGLRLPPDGHESSEPDSEDSALFLHLECRDSHGDLEIRERLSTGNMDPHTKMKCVEDSKSEHEAPFFFPNGGNGLLGFSPL